MMGNAGRSEACRREDDSIVETGRDRGDDASLGFGVTKNRVMMRDTPFSTIYIRVFDKVLSAVALLHNVFTQKPKT